VTQEAGPRYYTGVPRAPNPKNGGDKSHELPEKLRWSRTRTQNTYFVITVETVHKWGVVVNSVALLLVVLGLACVASAIAGGGLRLIGWVEIPAIGSFRRQIALGIFGTVVALGGFSQYAGSGGAPEAKHAPSLSPPNLINPEPIKIDRIHTQIPRCVTFGGQGVVSANKTLWLVVLGPDSKDYFFGPVSVNVDRHGWILRKVNIGEQWTPPGTRFTIFAVLVNNATSELLHEGNFVGGIPNLLSNFHKVDHIEVERSGDGTACK
jgi:hypothetical protein